MSLPAPAEVERFRRGVEGLALPNEAALGIAVSGGPDSLALLLLAAAAFPGRIAAATVDHRLRPEGADEAAEVERICNALDVPHATLRSERPPDGNIQSAARALRYRLLADWARREGLACLLTAHHVDDQAETLLMRLLRGAGLAGLAGIRPRVELAGIPVLRPLLGWRRAELAAIVERAGLDAASDPGNRDERFDRARLRRRLAQTEWLEPEPLARSAAALAEAEEALDWTARRLREERIERDSDGYVLDPRDLPAELRRRLVLFVLETMDRGAVPRGDEVTRLLATLAAGGTATLAGVRCRGGERWRLEPAPPRRSG